MHGAALHPLPARIPIDRNDCCGTSCIRGTEFCASPLLNRIADGESAAKAAVISPEITSIRAPQTI